MRIPRLFATSLLVIAITSCSSNKNAENPSGSSSGSLLNRASNMVGGIDAFSAFMKANAAKEKATSYRMKMEMNTEGQGMTSLTEVQCPDKFHQTGEFMGRKMDQYHIGNTMYMNTGGTWKSIKMPTPYDCHGHVASSGGSAPARTSSGSSKDPSDSAARQIEKAKDEYTFTKGDVITVEGDPCQQYTITSKNPNETKMKSMAFCVGTKDDLLRQMKTNQMTMTYYDWNKDLGIKPPM